jgi:hypothetical protein
MPVSIWMDTVDTACPAHIPVDAGMITKRTVSALPSTPLRQCRYIIHRHPCSPVENIRTRICLYTDDSNLYTATSVASLFLPVHKRTYVYAEPTRMISFGTIQGRIIHVKSGLPDGPGRRGMSSRTVSNRQ